MYKCSKCGAEIKKPGYCKDCANAYSREWKRENPKKVKVWKKQWREDNPEKLRGYRKKYRDKPGTKEEMKAQSYANRHKEELMEDKCEVCDTTKNLLMHHPDYSKPAWVLTLCPEHHREMHLLNKLT